MALEGWINASHAWLSARRRPVLLLVVILLVAGSLSLLRLQLSENAAALIPDRDPQLLQQFQLLQQAPMTRKLVVLLEAEESRDPRLTEAGAAYVERFNRAGVGTLQSRMDADLPGLLQQLVTELPQRFPAAELAHLAEQLTPEEIGRRLRAARDELLSAAGLGSKRLIQADPLDLRRRLFADLAYTNLLGRGRISGGYLWSADRRGLLLVGETDIALTDVKGAAALERAAQAAATGLPPGIKAELLCGQRYTLANAGAIKHDVRLIGLLVSAGLLLLFGFFLRDWRALPVLLLPLAAVALALGLVMLSGRELSGITLGFGAVVLGVALDYGLHVYFSLRHRKRNAGLELAALVRPLGCGALTSIGAFAVLLGSALPVQRQLGGFAGLGLLLALLLALLVLPLLLTAPARPLAMSPEGGRLQGRGRLLLGCWGLLLLIGLGGALQVRINGDLRQVNLVPPQLKAAETRLRQGWGDLHGRALLISRGSDQKAHQANEQLFSRLREDFAPGELVSLAPLLPSRARRQANQRAWVRFWGSAAGEKIRTGLQQQAGAIGFAPTAFAPFIAGMTADLPAERELPQGFGELLSSLRSRRGEELQLMTLVEDRPQLGEWLQGEELQGVTLLSPQRFRRALSHAVESDFLRLAPLAGGVVVLLVSLLLRRRRLILAALAPVISGVVAMFGVMGWCGLEFNLFNSVATVLVIGLTIDYGIFMVWRQLRGGDRVTDRAVLVSGLTTLAGFGSLALASHPALFAIGISVLIGIGAAVPTALWLVPALVPREKA